MWLQMSVIRFYLDSSIFLALRIHASDTVSHFKSSFSVLTFNHIQPSFAVFVFNSTLENLCTGDDGFCRRMMSWKVKVTQCPLNPCFRDTKMRF